MHGHLLHQFKKKRGHDIFADFPALNPENFRILPMIR